MYPRYIRPALTRLTRKGPPPMIANHQGKARDPSAHNKSSGETHRPTFQVGTVNGDVIVHNQPRKRRAAGRIVTSIAILPIGIAVITYLMRTSGTSQTHTPRQPAVPPAVPAAPPTVAPPPPRRPATRTSHAR